MRISATGCSSIMSSNVTQSHDSSTSIATVNCKNASIDVGDYLSISMGFVGGTYDRVFRGLVKAKNYNTPEGLYTVTAHDVMTRAVDFFIVSSDPKEPIQLYNVSAEYVVQYVMGLAGLSSFTSDPTYLTLGINSPVEINLVGAYDYGRMISDLVAFNLWADADGLVHMENRKPYPMDGSSGQPGDTADGSIGSIDDDEIYSLDFGFNEKDLRNRIVVYGAEDIFAEAKQASSYDPYTGGYRQILPSGYYKAAVLASPLIETVAFAQAIANYNLGMLNRLTYETQVTIEGRPTFEARKCITLSSVKAGISSSLWYIYQLEHTYSKSGYTTSLLLRK